MKYILTLRPINETDLKSTLPFLPEDEEVNICLESIEGELNGLECLAGVWRDGNSFHLTTGSDTNFAQIRGELKPILSGRLAEIVRFVSLE